MNIIKQTTLALLASGLLAFSSCDNELDLTAEYKEIGVIYGVINPADSLHIIRIQKAFLGEGNANVMAQVTDSLYYPDILDVQLHRIKDGEDIGSFPLTRFIGPPKDAGTFPSTPNILYKSNGEQLFRDSEYKIIVRNTQTGHVFDAQTPIVDSLRILRPTLNEKIRWANVNPVLVEYVPTPNGKVYNLTIRFFYSEEVAGSGNVVNKSMDWIFPNKVVTNPENVNSIQMEIKGEDFYEFVAAKLPIVPGLNRYAGKMDFIYAAGAEFLANYIAINQATTSILTTPPYYSNVNGGTGIFSSRFIQVQKNKEMDAAALDELKTGDITGDLGFQ